MKHILFVCHGNFCRSPMAEYVMKHLVRERPDWRTTSKSPRQPPAGRSWGARSILRPGKSWLSTASPVPAAWPTSSRTGTMTNTTCSSAWTTSTCGICTDEVADPWYTRDFDAAWKRYSGRVQGAAQLAGWGQDLKYNGASFQRRHQGG